MLTFQRPGLAAIPDHDGSPRATGDRFFSVPDARIGAIRSASTSERTPGPPQTADALVVRGLFGFAIGLSPLLLVSQGGGTPMGEMNLASYAGAVAFGLLVFWMTGPDRRCSYVGERGLWMSWRWLRVIPRRRVLRFEDAWEVSVAYTRVYTPGYRVTNARYTWTDDDGRRVFAIDTGFREYRLGDAIDLAPLADLPPEHPVVVARAAVMAFHAFIEADNAALDNDDPGAAASV